MSAFAAAGGLLLTQCKPFHNPTESMSTWPSRVPEEIVFKRDVKPLLEMQCLECHNSKDATQNAGFNLETRHLAMTTGRKPSAIRPGDPESSLLIQVLELDVNHPTNMPPAPDKIWGARMEILKKWIKQGAKWPENVRMVRPQDWAE